MAKSKIIYSCSNCGVQVPQWQGQCPNCGSWNTLEESISDRKSSRHQAFKSQSKLTDLKQVKLEEIFRRSSGNSELDRVLGGGVVQGGVVLFGGDPGIGKSTLLLQALAAISSSCRTIYVSGEESPQQIAMRAQRLQVKAENIKLLAEVQLESILKTINDVSPDVVVIDSIQTLYSEELQSAPGSVTQVRECAAQLTRLAKNSDIAILMVGHVTKEGSIAGPRVLEHMVDSVLYFEGDQHSAFRIVRAIKNRFGAVNELGVFAMTESGLKGVSNPSALFLSQLGGQVPGSCVLVTREATRTMLVEIQALVNSSIGSMPKRLSVGLENNRLAMLLAVINRHVGINVIDKDVFVNAVGGIKINEPAADLAIVLSIVSSLNSFALPKKMVVFGEIGLSGEIRPVQGGQDRLRESIKLGFSSALIPRSNLPKNKMKEIEIVGVESVEDAINHIINYDQ